jgi:hypothetical protein
MEVEMPVSGRSIRSLTKKRNSRHIHQNLLHVARTLAPTMFALLCVSAAHAQGTMDFSGAQTLMGTFNWRNDYVAVEQRSRNIVRNQYVHLVALHDQHVHFAKTWDNNLRLQGFAEAFSDKCILG